MFTDCPECERQFRIRAEQLRSAAGWVRCGFCGETFNALERLRDTPIKSPPTTPAGADAQLEPDPPTEEPEFEDDLAMAQDDDLPSTTPDESEPPELEDDPAMAQDDDLPSTTPDESEPPEFEDDPAMAQDDDLPSTTPDESEPPEFEDDPAMAQDDDLPHTELIESEPPDTDELNSPAELLFELDSEAENRGNDYNKPLWGGIVLLLLALAGAQLVWFNRDPLLRDFPWLRPWTETLCEHLECRTTRFRDTSAIKLLEREVRLHPRYHDSLVINATMINQAEFAQPYPQVQLLIFNRNGRIVAHRNFTPADYLTDNETATNPAMPPDLPVSFTLELSGAREDVVSYEFRFH